MIKTGIIKAGTLQLFYCEAHFYLSGHVSTRHCIIWSQDNPHSFGATPLHSVWCGFTANFILAPAFFENQETFNQHSYLRILHDHVAPILQNHNNLTFMQDGATPHRANIVKDYLSERFHGNIIGLEFERKSPPRSPDLNPCDFFLWGFFKLKVYQS